MCKERPTHTQHNLLLVDNISVCLKDTQKKTFLQQNAHDRKWMNLNALTIYANISWYDVRYRSVQVNWSGLSLLFLNRGNNVFFLYNNSFETGVVFNILEVKDLPVLSLKFLSTKHMTIIQSD